ncbi:MAG: hypothetical protein ACRDHM_02660 [Actinomycetota bacterium]
MGDFRADLDRLARGINENDGSLDRVRIRARRRHLTRRFTAGVVALAVTGASIGLAMAAFRGTENGKPRPAAPAPNVHDEDVHIALTAFPLAPFDPSPSSDELLRIWPEGTAKGIDEMQQEVDEGNGTWRRDDPEAVARAFAVEEMAWGEFDTETRISSDDPFRLAIWNPSLAEQIGSSEQIETTLFMERWRGRKDGILIVTRAENELLEISSPIPFEPASVDGKIRFEGELSPVTEELNLTLTLRGDGGTSSLSSTHADKPSADGTYEVSGAFGGSSVEQMAFLLTFVDLSRVGPTPVPGPSPTSEDATPAPVRIVVGDRTGAQNAFPYVFAWIESQGPGTHHGGYDLGDADAQRDHVEGNAVSPTLQAEPIPVTRIYFEPGYEAEADRMQQLLFPGAEIGPPPPDDGVRVSYADQQPLLHAELGRDFVERHAELIRAFNFLGDFAFMREAGSSSAESFVTEQIARKYEEDRYLSMYEYAEGRSSRVGFIGIPEDGIANVDFFLHFSDGSEFNTEALRVAKIDGELKVVQATLSSGGSM